jgi:hypothetical protein
MDTPITHPQCAPAGALARLSAFARGIAGFAWLRAIFARPRAIERRAAERDALHGLSVHVLRDIGASPPVIADAMACARDDYPVDFDRTRY